MPWHPFVIKSIHTHTHIQLSALRLLTTCTACVCVCADERRAASWSNFYGKSPEAMINPASSFSNKAQLPPSIYHTHTHTIHKLHLSLSFSIRPTHIVSHLWVILIFKSTYKNHLKTSTPDAWMHKYAHSPPHILYISCALSLISLSRCVRTCLIPAGSLEMLFLLNTNTFSYVRNKHTQTAQHPY